MMRGSWGKAETDRLFQVAKRGLIVRAYLINKREVRCPPKRVDAPAQPLAVARVAARILRRQRQAVADGPPRHSDSYGQGPRQSRRPLWRATRRERTPRNGMPLRTVPGEGTLAGAQRRRRA